MGTVPVCQAAGPFPEPQLGTDLIMRIVSWNVNGLRAVMGKGFEQAVEQLDADILCLQETKLQADQRTAPMLTIPGYGASYWSYASKKGYSGVAVYTRNKPIAVHYGIGIPKFDDEGRILRLDFPDVTVFNVYFPNGQMSDERLRYKLDFYDAFFQHTQALRQDGRSLVITGDYNTAHNEIDLKNPGPNAKRSGFLRIERDWMDRIIDMGYVDTFRAFYPDTVTYSWWSYRFNARKNNAGWRIDYCFVSPELMETRQVTDAFIENDIFGSDHCPVGIMLAG